MIVIKNRKKSRISDVHIESDIVETLNGLHASSGNDYISSFCRKRINICFKDIHMEKTPSNKTPALLKSVNMDVWIVGILN